MLRRVAQALRVLLLLAALLCVAWFPVSWFYHVWIQYQGTPSSAGVGLDNGAIVVAYIRSAPPQPIGIQYEFGRLRPGDEQPTRALYPQYRRVKVPGIRGWTVASFPLWLLAVVCLAWPVTSFVIARRRRRGQGFPVEAKAGGAVSTVDS